MRGIALDGVPVVDYETTEKCGECGTTLLNGATTETCDWCRAQQRLHVVHQPATNYGMVTASSYYYPPMISTHVPVETVSVSLSELAPVTPTIAEPTLDDTLALCPMFRPSDSALNKCKCGNWRVDHSRLQIESWQASLSMVIDSQGRRTW
jgi:hypothetical protein